MRAIVVAGGDAVPEDAAHLRAADLVIAADSGARWLDGQGRRPDWVVGDMDSIEPALLDRLAASGVEIERLPVDKDESDAELAVRRAIESGANEVVILGALGGARVDHQLANLLQLAGPARRDARLRIVRGGTSVLAVAGGERIDLDGANGDLVTLLPIGGDATGVHTEGLGFPLHGETLGLGSSRGLSNVVVRAPASVSLESGTLLVIETGKESGR